MTPHQLTPHQLYRICIGPSRHRGKLVRLVQTIGQDAYVDFDIHNTLDANNPDTTEWVRSPDLRPLTAMETLGAMAR